jgi:RNA recognition motif-containing protein
MANRIYVGNLPFTMTSFELIRLFAQSGKVSSASIVEDRLTGRSRGFAFVEMTSDEDAATAIAELNGRVVGGRQLAVNAARPRAYVFRADYEPQRGRFGSDGGYGKIWSAPTGVR